MLTAVFFKRLSPRGLVLGLLLTARAGSEKDLRAAITARREAFRSERRGGTGSSSEDELLFEDTEDLESSEE